MHVYISETAQLDTSRPHIRRHLLQQVVRNLLKESNYYAEALILTSLSKQFKGLNIYSNVYNCMESTSACVGALIGEMGGVSLQTKTYKDKAFKNARIETVGNSRGHGKSDVTLPTPRLNLDLINDAKPKECILISTHV